MPKLPRLSGRDLLRALEKAGFRVAHGAGSHVTLRHPETGRTATLVVSRQELPVGTIASVLRQAGLSTEDLQRLV